ncbi:hypothetical protein PG996_015546 [Apiospora saccharicola]|uniref:F-box domain-containing protein n=1 Tax=Apiospora saccharicola TaxID=335842 RepID=A0ABR1TM57_9PEZI
MSFNIASLSSNIASCGLESLPVDVLVPILSASDSLADLHAFIRASHWLYRVFLGSKRAILLAIVSKDAGPVTRDYVALLLTPKLDPCHAYYHDNLLGGIRKYQAVPPGSEATMGITVEQVIDIIRLQRTVHFYIGLYELTQLPRLEQEYTPAAATPWCPHEHQRLSRTLVRHQILTRLNSWKYRQSIGRGVDRLFLNTLEDWEIEQISVAHAFVYTVICALHVSNPACTEYSRLRTRDWMPCRDRWYYTDNLSTLRCQIVSLSKTRIGFMVRLKEEIRKRGASRYEGNWGLIKSLNVSHYFSHPRSWYGSSSARILAQLGGRRAVYEAEKARPRLFAGVSVGEPPFGWVDAMGGA